MNHGEGLTNPWIGRHAHGFKKLCDKGKPIKSPREVLIEEEAVKPWRGAWAWVEGPSTVDESERGLCKDNMMPKSVNEPFMENL